jgi:hypothetical protein
MGLPGSVNLADQLLKKVYEQWRNEPENKLLWNVELFAADHDGTSVHASRR